MNELLAMNQSLADLDKLDRNSTNNLLSKFLDAAKPSRAPSPETSQVTVTDDQPILTYKDLQVDDKLDFVYSGSDPNFVLTINVEEELRFTHGGEIVVNCHANIHCGYAAGPIYIRNDHEKLNGQDGQDSIQRASDGANGANEGANGPDGRPAGFDSKDATPGGNGGRGDHGQPGTPGHFGVDGNDGERGPDLTFIAREFLNGGSAVVKSIGGNGGRGGRGQLGGNGGNGRAGGNGGKGGDARVFYHRPAKGGNGGDGGNAGSGGRGGDHGKNGRGGDGGDVTILYIDPNGFPLGGSALSQFGEGGRKRLVPAFGGKHGEPGEGGKAGKQGEPFPGRGWPPHAADGSDGKPVDDPDDNGIGTPGDIPPAGGRGKKGLQDGPRVMTNKDSILFVGRSLRSLRQYDV